jgi:hypothetical protein
MTKRSDHSGVTITGSTVTGVVAGAHSTIHAQVSSEVAGRIEAEAETLRRALQEAADNDAQRAMLDRHVAEIAASAAKKDEPGFQRHVSSLSELLAAFGKGLKGVGEALPALKAIAMAAGMALPF